MRRCLLLLVLCLALIGSACGAAQETPAAPGALPSTRGADPDTGGGKNTSLPEDPAPDFSVTTFDGETFALGEQRGTPVVLNFWESW